MFGVCHLGTVEQVRKGRGVWALSDERLQEPVHCRKRTKTYWSGAMQSKVAHFPYLPTSPFEGSCGSCEPGTGIPVVSVALST